MISQLIAILLVTQAKGYWLEVASSPSLGAIKRMVSAMGKDAVRDGDVVHVLVLPPEEEEEHPEYRLLFGPFDSGSEAFGYGLSLLHRERIESFSVTDVHASARIMRIPRRKRRALVPFSVPKPYPAMGITLASRVLGYSAPASPLPPMESAVASLAYRDEFWILGERQVCTKARCRRWYYGLTPAPHKLAWVPAGFVVPVSKVRSVKNDAGELIAYTVVDWYARTQHTWHWWAAIFSPGRRPLRWQLDTPRFFYLRLVRGEEYWKVMDARNVVHAQYKRSQAQWRPVQALFSSKSRREVFR